MKRKRRDSGVVWACRERSGASREGQVKTGGGEQGHGEGRKSFTSSPLGSLQGAPSASSSPAEGGGPDGRWALGERGSPAGWVPERVSVGVRLSLRPANPTGTCCTPGKCLDAGRTETPPTQSVHSLEAVSASSLGGLCAQTCP